MPTQPSLPTGTAEQTDAAIRADLDTLLARLQLARGRKLGFPDASDFDYSELAPFLGYLLNNLGDPRSDGVYPWHTKPMEREAVATVAGLLRAPEHDWWGYVTSGATEGTEYALWQARRRYPDAIVYTSTGAHHATFAVLDRLAMPTITVRTDTYGEIDYDDLHEQVDRHRRRPAVIVANAGTGWDEAVDDVRVIGALLDDLAVRQRWIHADAALSGLPLAVTDPDRRPGFDFTDGADSVIVSGHKALGSPVPSGVVVVRASLREHGRTATYTGAPDATVNNSRSGLAALIWWYALRRHGIDGLRTRAERSRELAGYLHGRLVAAGWPEVHRHPHACTVTFTAPPLDVARRWCLPVQDDRSRVVTVPGVTREQVDAFLADLCTEPADSSQPPTSGVNGRRSRRVRSLRGLTGGRSADQR
jgi:histidine decarboxylase